MGRSAKDIEVSVVEEEMRPQISDMGDNIPQVVVSLIQDCWHQEGKHRPTFHAVNGIISDQLRLVEEDLIRIQEGLKKEESNKSMEQINRLVQQSWQNSIYSWSQIRQCICRPTRKIVA